MRKHQKKTPKEVITKNLAEVELLVSRSNAEKSNSSDSGNFLIEISSVPSYTNQSCEDRNVIYCHKQFRNIGRKHESRCDAVQNSEKELSKRLQEAQHRAKEARNLWLEREATLQRQKAYLEFARQQQEEHKYQLKQLAAGARNFEPVRGRNDDLSRSNWQNCLDSLTSLESNDFQFSAKRRTTELLGKKETVKFPLSQVHEVSTDNSPLDDTLQQLFENKGQLARYQTSKRDAITGGDDNMVQTRDEFTEIGLDDTTIEDTVTRAPHASIGVGCFCGESNKCVMAETEYDSREAQTNLKPEKSYGDDWYYLTNNNTCCPNDFDCNDLNTLDFFDKDSTSVSSFIRNLKTTELPLSNVK